MRREAFPDEGRVLAGRPTDDTEALKEAMDTLANLPDDDELIALIEGYSDALIDVARANEIITPVIDGLPPEITADWAKPWLADLPKGDDETSEETTVAAYSLAFEAGFEQRYGHEPTMLINLTDNLSLQGVILRAIPSSSWHSFEVFSNTGRPLAVIDGQAVLNLLASLLNDPEIDNPKAHFYSRFQRLIGNLGDRNGIHRRENRLSTGIDLLPNEEAMAAGGALIEVYGAVCFAESEEPRQSHREFVIERLVKFRDLDYDILYRMIGKYYGGGDKAPSEADFTPARLALRGANPLLERITYSPSRSGLCEAKFEIVSGGKAQTEPFDAEHARLIIDTLQQVAASSVDNLQPRLS